MRRIGDLVGASALLIVVLPVILVAALVSFGSYRRWPFFTQWRVGRGGRRFRVVKIRTLHPRTPTSLAKAELVSHQPNGACRFLRAHHLDELPQLINVLAGSMSLVGPRPELVELQHLFDLSFARRRTRVRPGITGLWQVSRSVEAMIADHPEYDDYYVAAKSVRLDLWILWRTAIGLFGDSPIESLDEVPAWCSGEVPTVTEIGDRPV